MCQKNNLFSAARRSATGCNRGVGLGLFESLLDGIVNSGRLGIACLLSRHIVEMLTLSLLHSSSSVAFLQLDPHKEVSLCWTIMWWVTNYKATGSALKKKNGRPSKVSLDQENIDRVCTAVEISPHRPPVNKLSIFSGIRADLGRPVGFCFNAEPVVLKSVNHRIIFVRDSHLHVNLIERMQGTSAE